MADRIQTTIVEPLNADFYISTCDTPALGGFYDEVGRLIADEVCTLLPSDLLRVNASSLGFRASNAPSGPRPAAPRNPRCPT